MTPEAPKANEVPIVNGYEKLVKGGVAIVERRSLMEKIREEASRRVVADMRGKFGLEEFYDKLAEVGIVVWLEFFPQICLEMMEVNREKWRILNEMGNTGAFTGTAGWSADGNFKFKWEFTPEFYFFMRNYVYSGFFDKSEQKICDGFMRQIMRGSDPIPTLMWVKQRYGSNQQGRAVVSGGGR